MPSVYTQARSFCRGLLARAVDPSIRSRLMTRLDTNHEELSHLRSFLDLERDRTITDRNNQRIEDVLREHVQPQMGTESDVITLMAQYAHHHY